MCIVGVRYVFEPAGVLRVAAPPRRARNLLLSEPRLHLGLARDREVEEPVHGVDVGRDGHKPACVDKKCRTPTIDFWGKSKNVLNGFLLRGLFVINERDNILEMLISFGVRDTFRADGSTPKNAWPAMAPLPSGIMSTRPV